jgi:peptidoglycan/xylan/chitin deacetylase (PgdA/CDA1 family)
VPDVQPPPVLEHSVPRSLAPAQRLRFTLVIYALERFAADRPIRLLDAGSGDGSFAVSIARRHPGWTVVGVDLRDELLERGRRAAAGTGLANVEFVHADLTEDLGTEEYDAVAAIECLEEIPDDRVALGRMTVALRQGGLLLAHVPERAWRPVLRGSEPTWRHEVRHGYSPAELESLLVEFGLEDVRIDDTCRGLVRLAQELRDLVPPRHPTVRAAVSLALAGLVPLERSGLTWGRGRALLGRGRRPLGASKEGMRLEPEASILIVARTGGKPLQRCLQALCDQTQPMTSFDIAVVDAAAALPRALRSSRGRICIVLEEDMVASADLVAAHVAAHSACERLVGIGQLTQELPFRSHIQETNISFPHTALDGRGLEAFFTPDSPAPLLEFVLDLEAEGYTFRRLPDARAQRASSMRRQLAGRMIEGAAHAELARRREELTPCLLGWFVDASARELVLRRALLALRAGPDMLAALRWLLPGRNGKRLWVGFVSNFAYWRAVRKRLPRREWKLLTRGVPILLYHAFAERHDRSRFVVTRRTFGLQMKLLELLGYRVLTYDDFATSFRNGRLPPPRTVVLTMDDGYADNAEIAAEVLGRRRYGATIFLVSDRLGALNDWSDASPLLARPLLTVAQIAALGERGVSFGAHTRTHSSLPDLPDDALAGEVEASRAELEHVLECPVQSFAYPYGRLDDRAVAAVRRAGFVSACTTEPRLARLDDDPLRIPRIEIKGSDSLWRFLMKVWFGGA